MKHSFLLILSFCLTISLTDAAPPAKKALPRVAIAGLGIESSTFSPALTTEEAFKAKYGNDIFTSYPFLAKDSLDRGRANWIPALMGKSLPGGAVTREAYESLVKQTLALLKK